MDETPLIFSIVVPQEPAHVANALRDVANRIAGEHLTLIGLWSTGFGEPHEAVLQVVATTTRPSAPYTESE